MIDLGMTASGLRGIHVTIAAHALSRRAVGMSEVLRLTRGITVTIGHWNAL